MRGLTLFLVKISQMLAQKEMKSILAENSSEAFYINTGTSDASKKGTVLGF